MSAATLEILHQRALVARAEVELVPPVQDGTLRLGGAAIERPSVYTPVRLAGGRYEAVRRDHLAWMAARNELVDRYGITIEGWRTLLETPGRKA